MLFFIHYWNPLDVMSYLFVNFVTFLVSTERNCHICDIIVLNKLTLTQSCISDRAYHTDIDVCYVILTSFDQLENELRHKSLVQVADCLRLYLYIISNI